MSSMSYEALRIRTNDQAERDSIIADALAQLQTGVESKPASENLAAWVGTVRDALVKLGEPLRTSLTVMHDELFKTILQQDDGLIRRVELLKEADLEILADLDHMRMEAEALICDAAMTDDTSQVRRDVARLIEGSEELLIRVRMHRQAVTDCLQEAFHLDRGRVD